MAGVLIRLQLRFKAAFFLFSELLWTCPLGDPQLAKFLEGQEEGRRRGAGT
jgi:hypothetical protein